MPRVTVLVLHPDPPSDAGPLTRSLADARLALAARHIAGFRAVGAEDVRLVRGPADDTPFGTRLRSLVHDIGPAGLVVLGSGAMPLATAADRRAFVAVAASGRPAALANDRYSADVVAVGQARVLDALPDIETDNALPRWLGEVGGFAVDDLRGRWRLGVDLDSPADVVLATADRAGAWLRPHIDPRSTMAFDEARARLAAVLADRRAEVVVAGRTSARTLAWLERSTACRVRAIVEERGLRAASSLAQSDPPSSTRRPASIVGLLLDRDGPEAFGTILASLGDGAVVDTRVLMAHRGGRDEAAWPAAEDRFASDLLLAERIGDPWLAALTASAARAPIPIVLGGHTLVGPALGLVARQESAGPRPR